MIIKPKWSTLRRENIEQEKCDGCNRILDQGEPIFIWQTKFECEPAVFCQNYKCGIEVEKQIYWGKEAVR